MEPSGEGIGLCGAGPGMDRGQAENEAAEMERQREQAEVPEERGDPVRAEGKEEDERAQDTVGGIPAASAKPFIEECVTDRGRQKEGDIQKMHCAERFAPDVRGQIVLIEPEHADRFNPFTGVFLLYMVTIA